MEHQFTDFFWRSAVVECAAHMCLELMLIASTLALVAFSRFNATMDGNIFVFFILTVAAAEVAVGLAIIVALFRKRQTVQIDQLDSLKN